MTLEQTLSEISGQLGQWQQEGLNEAQTSQVIVLRILQALGYSIWNPFEVVPEWHSGGGSGAYRPDYTIRLQGHDKLILEVKALNREFSQNDQSQSVNYVNTLGRRWAILTNGKAWHFFDNHITRSAPEKLKLTVDVLEQGQFASAYLQALLGKTVWQDPAAEDVVARESERINNDIRRRIRLSELERTLRQEMLDGFSQDERGLRRAIEFILEPNERTHIPQVSTSK